MPPVGEFVGELAVCSVDEYPLSVARVPVDGPSLSDWRSCGGAGCSV